jgi:FAD/FMN-containing dehydrogenase
LLGPGTGRRTAYLEITPSMSRPTDAMFARVERIILKHAGRPHLGKKVFVTRAELEGMYPPEIWNRFQSARRSQDPAGKFLNGFTTRLLG